MNDPVTIGDCVIHHGDCIGVLAGMEPNSVDSCVTDPPYHLTSIVKRFGKTSVDGEGTNEKRAKAGADGMARLSRGFMGKKWDGGDVAFRPETWAAVYRVLKPGAHLLAFSGTRTYHRMACAIEDAGFEVRDMVQWVYGSGFPKSHDVSKAIDKAAGVAREKIATGNPVKRMIPGADQNSTGSWIKDNGREYQPGIEEPATEAARQWQGWGTALKPACEPICVARKPLIGTVAANVLEHGTGALNIDGCRVECAGGSPSIKLRQAGAPSSCRPGEYGHTITNRITPERWEAPHPGESLGRWPANLCHDGSEEVLAGFPESGNGSGKPKVDKRERNKGWCNSSRGEGVEAIDSYGDTGTAARFFYCAKASKADRLGSKHPTVKPVNLMRWLVRLVTPPGGIVLDPFAGSGTTGMACLAEGFRPVLIELEAESVEDIKRRIRHVAGSDGDLFAQIVEQDALL